MRWEADVPLAGLTRLAVGGATPRLARPDSPSSLREVVRGLEGIAFRVLGGGANTLVSDAGVGEPVLILEGEFDRLELSEEEMQAGAATPIPALVNAARRAGREGYVFLEAVPGTVGGALRMNAGSAETGLWDRVVWVTAMTPEGETLRITSEEARPRYRGIGVPEEWVLLGGAFAAPPGDPGRIKDAHRERRRTKVETQVYELPSCGSTWKNPGGPYGAAWEIVERVGMRGARRGSAVITERHANFIVNLGGATAADILGLMVETRRRAYEELGVSLEPEIRLWGFTDDELRAVGAKA
ncbi:MAG: FAD-binding protein [Gemmatimonadota bacterium]